MSNSKPFLAKARRTQRTSWRSLRLCAKYVFNILSLTMVVCVVVGSLAWAQSKGAAPAPSKAKSAGPSRTPATLGQLMKGILFPASNVIFAAQDKNPNDVPPAKDPALSTDPLA